MRKPLSDRLFEHAERLKLAAARTDELAIADALRADLDLILEAAERIRSTERPGIIHSLRRAFSA